MSSFDFNAHSQLSGKKQTDIQLAIQKAQEKSSQGLYVVCVTTSGIVLVLPEFSVSVRNDIAEIVYDTDKGYRISTKRGA